MKITFDPPKRLETLADRHLDFLDAKQVLSGRVLTTEDTRGFWRATFSNGGLPCRPDGDGGLDAARQGHSCNFDEEVQ